MQPGPVDITDRDAETAILNHLTSRLNAAGTCVAANGPDSDLQIVRRDEFSILMRVVCLGGRVEILSWSVNPQGQGWGTLVVNALISAKPVGWGCSSCTSMARRQTGL